MNYALAMSANLEIKQRRQASLITAGVAGMLVLLLFLLRWEMPQVEKLVQQPGIEVELNLPEDPLPETEKDGGGGGGNPVQASGTAGMAPAVLPAPGEREDSRELEEDKNSESPAIAKPTVVTPEAKRVANKSPEKSPPKPTVAPPAPPRPKAVLGRTTTGAGRGGGSTDDYERPGGSGTGAGVGKGGGTGGGAGDGAGGGNGTGSGTGNGPRVTRGDRKIVRYYSFEGDLDQAVIYANVLVSPEGMGKFMSIAKGSSNSSNAYKEAIIQYLQNIRFDKSDHESMLTVQFNFRVN